MKCILPSYFCNYDVKQIHANIDQNNIIGIKKYCFNFISIITCFCHRMLFIEQLKIKWVGKQICKIMKNIEITFKKNSHDS